MSKDDLFGELLQDAKNAARKKAEKQSAWEQYRARRRRFTEAWDRICDPARWNVESRTVLEQRLLDLEADLRLVGQMLVEDCWDFWLQELAEKAAETETHPGRHLAIALLLESTKPDAKITDRLRQIHEQCGLSALNNMTGWDSYTEKMIGVAQSYFQEVRDVLSQLEHQGLWPWTPEMSVAKLARALKGYLSEEQIRRRLDEGQWHRYPDWKDKSTRRGRFRSKDPKEQAEILRRVRAF